MAPWLRLAAGALALVLLTSLVQFVLVVHPPRQRSRVTPDRLGVPYEAVRFETADGLTLAAWFVPAANQTDRTLLVGHGYPFDKGDVLPGTLFLREQFNLLYLDHRSFGESEGAITTVGLREILDVQAAVDYLAQRNDVRRVGALGFSLSAATLLMAQDPRIDAIVADSSYARLDDLTGELYPLGPLNAPFVWTTHLYARVLLGAWPSQASPVDAIEGTLTPTLIVHGSQDRTIDPSHARRLAQAAPEGLAQLWIVEGAQHGATHVVAGDAYEQRVLAFLDRHVGT